MEQCGASSWPHHRLSRFVLADGIRWHVQQCGSGPVMLLVHGTGASTHTWRDLLDPLAAHYTVVAIDLPGHGFTTPARGSGYSIGGMSRGLAALVRELEIEPQYGVGHSAGAVILCRMVLDGNLRPQRLVSINGAFLPWAGAAGVMFSPMARLISSTALIPRLLAWRAGNSASVERALAGTGSRLTAEGVRLYTCLVSNPQHVAAALGMMGHWDLYAFERQLPALKVPLTLLVGDNDRTVPPPQALRVQQLVAGADIVHLPGLGHLAHEERPVSVARQLAVLCGANHTGGA